MAAANIISSQSWVKWEKEKGGFERKPKKKIPTNLGHRCLVWFDRWTMLCHSSTPTCSMLCLDPAAPEGFPLRSCGLHPKLARKKERKIWGKSQVSYLIFSCSSILAWTRNYFSSPYCMPSVSSHFCSGDSPLHGFLASLHASLVVERKRSKWGKTWMHLRYRDVPLRREKGQELTSESRKKPFKAPKLKAPAAKKRRCVIIRVRGGVEKPASGFLDSVCNECVKSRHMSCVLPCYTHSTVAQTMTPHVHGFTHTYTSVMFKLFLMVV